MSTPSVIKATLNRSAQALLDGDFAMWSRSVMLPFTFVSRSGSKQYEAWDDLRSDFDTFVGLLAEHGVTEIRRNVISIDHVSPTHLIARFSTELLSGSDDIIAPYTSTATLQFRNGAWKAMAIMGAVGAQNWSEFAQNENGKIIPFHAREPKHQRLG
ncbi:hypothetical protein [Shimia ponticola]|uniref:hypothetical protein n=1 Tax=Shimia ponticola TaxID=2582893 RepID=UPI0011BDF81F|nr:hypothetical protein [Shimia ponticola]